MVARQHYRWDFIGLSTDNKPTPTTSEKVVDGSTFYCSDNSKLYVWYNDQWYEKTVSGGGGGTSDFDQLTNRPMYNGVAMTSETSIPEVISYTAGSNITISDGEISATDTTYSNFTGTDGTAAGAAGLVPAPATTDAGKFLKADGTWGTAGGSITPVQAPGTSTTDVMSQNAVTGMVFADPSNRRSVLIGSNGGIVTPQTYSVAIGGSATVTGSSGFSVALGVNTRCTQLYTIALGAGAQATVRGQFDVSTGTNTTAGYNNSNYRLLTGLYDPQSAHDAATKGYVDPTTDSSAPTTATVGRVGQFYIDTSTGSVYMCIAADSVTPAYTWKLIAS